MSIGKPGKRNTCVAFWRLNFNRNGRIAYRAGEKTMAWAFITILAAVLFSARSAPAQTTTGAITGTVTDETGAVVANATVKIVDMGTNVLARTLKTSSAGVYDAEELPVGTYQIEVEAPGFQRAVQSGNVVNVTDRLGVNIVMKVGTTTQSVEVKARAAVVETQTGEQSTLVSNTQLTELPILGRMYTQLQATIPGASRIGSDEIGKGYQSQQSFAINGVSDYYVGVLVDGVWSVDPDTMHETLAAPGPESLAEFKMLTANYSAKYGSAAAAEIVSITKSGGRDFHGGAFEYLRNADLNATDFFLNKVGAHKAPLVYNDFGYYLGGPVYIPGHYNTNKDKTFFFWSQEWLRNFGATNVTTAVPTLNMRTGNFNGVSTLKNPINPFTGVPMADSSGNPCVASNQINPNCMNANVLLLLKQDFPDPTPGATGFNNLVGAYSSGATWRSELIRVDQNINEKFRMLVRFDTEWMVEHDAQGYNDTIPSIGDIDDYPDRSILIKATNVINPTTVNEIGWGFMTIYPGHQRAFEYDLGAWQLPAGWTGKTVFGQNPYNDIPDMSFSGGYGGISDANFPFYEHNSDWQVFDSFSKQLGSHSLQAGGSAIFKSGWGITQITPGRQGAYAFDGHFSGNAWADALLGLANTYEEFYGYREPEYNWRTVEPYVQDDWKVNRRLTLNLGVRWYFLPPSYSDGLTQFEAPYYNPAQAVTVNPNGTIVAGSGNTLNGIVTAGQNGIPHGFSHFYKNTLAPRFGFAFDPRGNGKTAIRGGYGMGYNRERDGDFKALSGNPPLSGYATYTTVPFGNPAAGTAGAATALSLEGRGTPTYQVPTFQNWSFAVEHELNSNTLLSVGYAGSTAYHESVYENINQPRPAFGYQFDPRIACTTTTPYPCASRDSAAYVAPYQGWSAINTIETVGVSTYNGLQVKLDRRAGRGLTFGSSYTWSKNLGNVGARVHRTPENSYDLSADRGYTDFDRRQILVTNFVYQEPFFRGAHGIEAALLKGWETTGIVTFQTGLPANLGYSSSTAGLANRPNWLGSSFAGPRTVAEYFNTKAFAAPPFGFFGNADYDLVHGPGMNNWDMGWMKNFKLGERVNLQFRADTFNAWNHVSFNGLSATFGNSSFGQITSDHTPRTVEFALKLAF